VTAGGEHISVLLAQTMRALAIRPDGIYVDGTFGAGGHSRAILQALGSQGRLIAFDRDDRAMGIAAQLADARLTFVHTPFSRMAAVLGREGIERVDGIVLDLGVSSMQLEVPDRGLSFRFDAPLDMRMDTTAGETAAEFLAQADESEIERVVRDYGEERFAHAIATAIVAARRQRGISTTGELAALLEKIVRTREPGKHPATRSFQALRIHINRELEELSLVLPQCLAALRLGGRLAVISFHSLEDRMVKRFLRQVSSPPEMPKKLPITANMLASAPMRLVGKAQFPQPAEIARNPRSRSAVLRVAEKCTDH
jgi:16S rRNA (cytosine1402-N4)-methyltransferase